MREVKNGLQRYEKLTEASQACELAANNHHPSIQTQQQISGWGLRLLKAPFCGYGRWRFLPLVWVYPRTSYPIMTLALSINFHGQQLL